MWKPRKGGGRADTKKGANFSSLTTREMGPLASKAGPPGLLPARAQGIFWVVLFLGLAVGVGPFRGTTWVSHPVVLFLDEHFRLVVLVVTLGHGTRGLWPGMPAVFRHQALAYIRPDWGTDRAANAGTPRSNQARFGSGMGPPRRGGGAGGARAEEWRHA